MICECRTMIKMKSLQNEKNSVRRFCMSQRFNPTVQLFKISDMLIQQLDMFILIQGPQHAVIGMQDLRIMFT